MERANSAFSPSSRRASHRGFVEVSSAGQQSRCSFPAQPSYYDPSLYNLPYEIHILTFDQLDPEAGLRLALTSQYFWGVGRAQIMRFYASFLDCWAGSPFIMLGDGVEAGGHPCKPESGGLGRNTSK